MLPSPRFEDELLAALKRTDWGVAHERLLAPGIGRAQPFGRKIRDGRVAPRPLTCRSPARSLRLPAKPARCRARADVRNAPSAQHATVDGVAPRGVEPFNLTGLAIIQPDRAPSSPLPFRASTSSPGIREGQGPRRRRARRAQRA